MNDFLKVLVVLLAVAVGSTLLAVVVSGLSGCHPMTGGGAVKPDPLEEVLR